jgi:hypothetical protein
VEVRSYDTAGTLRWSCTLASVGAAGTSALVVAVASGRLYVRRASHDLAAYDLAIAPAAHGWIEPRGNFTGAWSAR